MSAEREGIEKEKRLSIPGGAFLIIFLVSLSLNLNPNLKNNTPKQRNDSAILKLIDANPHGKTTERASERASGSEVKDEKKLSRLPLNEKNCSSLVC